jgi:hypothetical protein
MTRICPGQRLAVNGAATGNRRSRSFGPWLDVAAVRRRLLPRESQWRATPPRTLGRKCSSRRGVSDASSIISVGGDVNDIWDDLAMATAEVEACREGGAERERQAVA